MVERENGIDDALPATAAEKPNSYRYVPGVCDVAAFCAMC